MDFNLKQYWRDESEEDNQETTPSSNKLPKLHLNSQHHHHHHHTQDSNFALPLFVSQPTTTNHLSAPYSSDTNPSTKSPRMGSYFSMAQWQELELQALIFRHMIAGADVPHELLHLVNKSLITTASPPYYMCNPLHQYYPHYQPALGQSGPYWGKGAMDPEPGRCRRTDGKKWRCSRDVVVGQKYCERHMHRGKNRSRKPVEIPSSTATTFACDSGGNGGGGGGGGAVITTNHPTAQGVGQFSLSSPSMDLLHFNQRPLNSISETKSQFDGQHDGQSNGGRTLRPFFDDWPRSLHETDNAASTNLSISMPGNSLSDFSLKLGTGNGDEHGAQDASGQRDRPQLNWGMAWETNRVAPMGGPLAEALRSSTNTSSPTSVLHRLARSSASEASYVST